MGSSGSGRLSDYPGSGRSKDKGGGSGGGKPGSEDRCARAFGAELEDVEHSTYFKKNKSVPPVGTELVIAHAKRVVAQTQAGEVVGNLPTKFNYLAACMKDGFTYVGRVRKAQTKSSVSTVSADFTAQPPT